MEQQEENSKDIQMENLRTGMQFEAVARIQAQELKGKVF